jgi:Protein of unknown function (DUF3592)
MSYKGDITVSIIGTVFSVLGIGFFVGSGLSFNSTRHFIDNSVSTNGVVIELNKEISSSKKSRSYIYYPVVKFEPKQGEVIEFESNSGSNPPSYKIGQTVPVLYEQNNPQSAQINSFFDLWFLPIFLVMMGSIFGGIGFSFLFFKFAAYKAAIHQ